MAKTQYLQFYVVLDDEAQVTALNAAHPTGYIVAPETGAAVEFSAPWVGPSDIGQTAPYTWSSHAISTISGGAYPTNVATFRRGGFLGFGETKFYWRGTFQYRAPAIEDAPADIGGPTVADPVEEVDPPARNWIEGFEFEALSASSSNFVSRTASRRPGGYGFIVRSDGDVLTHNATEYGATATASVEERFWIRVRKLPVGGAGMFWKMRGSVQSNSGLRLEITPTGQLAVQRLDNGSGAFLQDTLDIGDVGEWVRLDLKYKFIVGAGTAAVYINGELATEFTVTHASGLGLAQVHSASSIGASTSLCFGLELDVDDWVCSNVTDPADWSVATAYIINDVVKYNGKKYRCVAGHTAQAPPNATYWIRQVPADWPNGSRILPILPSGFSASGNAGFTGDYRELLGRCPNSGSTTVGLNSTTSGATIRVDTPDLGDANVLTTVVGAYTARAGSANGSITLNAVTTAVTENTTLGWRSVLYAATGTTPLVLGYTKGASTDNCDVRALMAQAEVAGPDPEYLAGEHNAPYPDTPWALQGTASLCPVVIVSGTYTGNGTGQDIQLPAPAAWYWVRPLTSGSGGGHWWSSMIAAHLHTRLSPNPEIMVQAAMDPSEDYPAGLLRVAGDNSQCNAVGVTYQYVAVCDPGMRFVLNGSCAHSDEASASEANALPSADFTPQAAFLQGESIGSTSTTRHYYRGPGHTASAASPLDAAEIADAISFAAGNINTHTTLHALNFPGGMAYSLWRTDDGSDDPGVHRVVQLGSYTGNGAASRTIALTPASDRYPLFAMVVPHNATAIYRDASNSGTASQTSAGTANASTGITGGGLDSITVGTTLNANGVVYDVFVIPGSASGSADGWSGNGIYIPVEPDSPTGGPWDDDPTDPDDIEEPEPEAPEVDPGDLTTDIAATCLSSSTRLVNQALEAIGITDRITSLAADTSQAADSARLHYKTVLDAVLRAYPWDFATRYATLTLVAGTEDTPANWDWQFSYRAPSDLVKARRLTVPGYGRHHNADPIPFRMGEDATGELLYTGEADTDNGGEYDLVLEYTARVNCPAGAKDALFRLAAKWALAAEFANSLAKDSKKAGYAHAMFLWALEQAKTKDAQEQQQTKDEGDADWVSGR